MKSLPNFKGISGNRTLKDWRGFSLTTTRAAAPGPGTTHTTMHHLRAIS